MIQRFSIFTIRLHLLKRSRFFAVDRQAGFTLHNVGYADGPVLLADDVNEIYQVAFHSSAPFIASFTR